MRIETSAKHQQITDITTQELVQRCLHKDQQAWEEFLRRYVSVIKKMIKVNLRRYKFAKWDDIDVIDDIWMKVFEKIYTGNGLALCEHFKNFDGWLWTITNSKTVDYCRKKIRSGQYDNLENNEVDPDKYRVDDWLEQFMYDTESIEELKKVLHELSNIKNQKIMWTMRLFIMVEEPLIYSEIESLAETFKCHDVPTIQQKLRVIQKRLRNKILEKQRIGESADKIWHEIRKLEYQLAEMTKHKTNKTTVEVQEIEQKIIQKEKRRTKLLHEADQFCRPSNAEIADLIGVPVEQAQQISSFLGRAREKIKFALQKENFLT